MFEGDSDKITLVACVIETSGCLNYKVRIPNTDEFRDLQGIDPWYEGPEGKEGRVCQLGVVVLSCDTETKEIMEVEIGKS